jgi:DNA replication protein DnaC
MSDNRTYERMHENLVKLRMFTAESVIDSQLEHAISNNTPFVDVLDLLLDSEVKARKSSAIAACTKLSGFPVKKTLDEFDISCQPSIDKNVFEDLKTLRFVSNQDNVIILGAPGVGKSHIAVGLGMEAIKAGYSVYYINSATLIEKLKRANSRGTLDRSLKTFGKYKVLIVDEIGYLPMDREGAHLFFQLVSRRYEKSSTIFTSNKTYSEWGEVLGDNVIASAVLDRILHHSITLNIKGESYRLRMRKKAGMPFPPPILEA